METILPKVWLLDPGQYNHYLKVEANQNLSLCIRDMIVVLKPYKSKDGTTAKIPYLTQLQVLDKSKCKWELALFLIQCFAGQLSTGKSI